MKKSKVPNSLYISDLLYKKEGKIEKNVISAYLYNKKN